MNEAVRLNKYLAECGVCSRREADKLIEAGRVGINGRAAELGDKVQPSDRVSVDGELVRGAAKKLVLAFYKPDGVVVSVNDPHAEETVFDYIDIAQRVTYAGRLDKDSEGLLLLTNDGDLIHAMMRGAAGHEKEYIVHLNKEPAAEVMERLAAGVYIPELKRKTKPCRVERIAKNTVRMVLKEGLNRQIRRMWSMEHYHVTALKRIRVVTVSLGDLRPGEYAQLSKKQCRELYKAVGLEYEDR